MDIRVVDDAAVLAGRWIVGRLRDAVRRRGSASLAVSGGSTAPPMIEALAGADLEWEAVDVWQVDERVAPDGDEARNARQLRPLEELPCRVHRMPVTARDLREAARRYGAGLPDRFDVVHLGLGDDGHTASWPPGRPDVRDSSEPVELVELFGGWPRMTLTAPVVNGARRRLVLAVGERKRPMVERWLQHDPSIPIAGVRRTGTWAFLDGAAAPATGRPS